jgi:hypothetical protein
MFCAPERFRNINPAASSAKIGTGGLIGLEIGGKLVVDPIDHGLQRTRHGRIVVARQKFVSPMISSGLL